jgi:DNA-binding beta-propeller fold protein YncE
VAVTADAHPPDPQGYLLEIDVRNGTLDRALPTGQNETHLVKLSKDKRTYFVSDLQGTFAAIDRSTGQVKSRLSTGPGTEGFDVSPDGKEVWVAAADTGRVTVLDAETLARKSTFTSKGGPIRVLFMPDSAHALLTHYDTNDVAVIDTRTHAEVARVPLEVPRIRKHSVASGTSGPMMIELNPAAHQAYVASEESDMVTAFDTERWKVVGYIKTGVAPDPLAFVR